MPTEGSEGSDLQENFCNQVEDMIREAIHVSWLHKITTPDVSVTPSPHQGGTNATILKAHVTLDIHVKYHLREVTKEYEGYQRLQQGPREFTTHLIPPLFSSSLPNYPQILPVWLVPLARAQSLHAVISTIDTSAAPPNWVTAIYDDFLDTTRALWTQTKKRAHPNLREIYVDRVYNRLQDLESQMRVVDLRMRQVSVNHQPPRELREIIAEFRDRVDALTNEVRFNCLAHYDEHANNIMIDDGHGEHDHTAWILIDYVNAQPKADWVFSIAKMVYWWEFYCIIEQAKSTAAIRDALAAKSIDTNAQVLDLTYDRRMMQSLVPRSCRVLRNSALRFADRMAHEFKEDRESWRKRLQLALFAVIFGSAVRQLPASRWAVSIMLGEAIEVLRANSLEEWFASS